MKWELNTVKSELGKIKKTSRNIETKLPGQTKQIDVKLKDLEESQNATAQKVSDLFIEVQDLSREVQGLTGRFEESRYFSEKSAAEYLESREMMAAKIKDLELAVKELEKNLQNESLQKKAAEEEEKKRREAELAAKAAEAEKLRKAQSRQSKPLHRNAKDAYMAAYQTYKEGGTAEARDQFLAVLEKYPENEYSDNARFWIAESYYKEGSYEDAILAYHELQKKNPGSDKVPGAMLKQGLAFFALKDRKNGTLFLEKLIEKYPESEQARLASKKLRKTVTPKKTVK